MRSTKPRKRSDDHGIGCTLPVMGIILHNVKAKCKEIGKIKTPEVKTGRIPMIGGSCLN